MTVLRYVVPVKPLGVNEMYQPLPNGGKRKSAEGVAFAGALAAFGLKARNRARLEPMTCKVDVLVTYYFQNERPDSDGPDKAVLDSLQTSRAHRHPAHRRVGAGIIENDRQVRDRHFRRRIDQAKPRVEITVGPTGEVFSMSELLEQELATP